VKVVYRSLQVQGQVYGYEAADIAIAAVLLVLTYNLPAHIMLIILVATMITLKFIKQGKPQNYLESLFLYIRLRNMKRLKGEKDVSL